MYHLYATEAPESKCFLRIHRLDQQGYDSDGMYFGIGQTLYRCMDDSGCFDVFQRANNRKEALNLIRLRFPHYLIELIRG